MAKPPDKLTDEQVEQTLGNLLRAGVLLATAVVLLGASLYLAHNGLKPIDEFHYRIFHGQPADLRSPVEIVKDADTFHSPSLIQLGLLLLIATPVARVLCSVYAFLRQRDYTYVVLTVIVLAVLLYSLFFGYTNEKTEGAGDAAPSSRFASTAGWPRPR